MLVRRSLFCLTTVGFALIGLSASAASPNLVRNGSFSAGLEGWSRAGGFGGPVPEATVDREVSHDRGGAALRLTTTAGARGLVRQSGLPRTESGKYVFSLWVRCRELDPGWIIRVGVEQYAKGKLVRTLQNRHLAHLENLDWTRIRIPFDLPADAEQLGVYVGLWFADNADHQPRAGGTVWFDDVALTPQPPPQADSRAAPDHFGGLELEGLFPEGRRGLFKPGEPVTVVLVGRNPGKTPAEFEARVAVKDFWGAATPGTTLRCRVEPGRKFSQRIELAATARVGFFGATAELASGGANYTLTSSFCVVTPGAARDSYFVVDVNGAESELVEAMQQIGVAGRKIGATMTWAPATAAEKLEYCRRLVSAGPITPYWNSKLDLIGNVYLGLTMPKRFDKAVDERRHRGLFPYPDEYFAEFGDFVEAMARAVRERVKLWVLSEEIDGTVGIPNLASGSPTAELMRYVLLSRIAYQRLKQVDPQCTVIGLAVSSDFNRTPRYGLVRQLLPCLKDYTDIIGPDLYTDPWNWCQEASLGPEVGEMRAKLGDTLALQTSLGKTRRTAISERGYGVPYHLAPDDPLEQRLANLTARSLILGKSVPEVLFYSLHMMASGAGWRAHRGFRSSDDDPLLDMGLWKVQYETDGRTIRYRPRSAVAAYATVARMLTGSSACQEILPQPEVFCYVFQRGESSVLAAWTNQPHVRTLVLEMPARSEITDLMGNRRTAGAGNIELRLSESPQFLETRVPMQRLAETLRARTAR